VVGGSVVALNPHLFPMLSFLSFGAFTSTGVTKSSSAAGALVVKKLTGIFRFPYAGFCVVVVVVVVGPCEFR
jgi:hypothetical protein